MFLSPRWCAALPVCCPLLVLAQRPCPTLRRYRSVFARTNCRTASLEGAGSVHAAAAGAARNYPWGLHRTLGRESKASRGQRRVSWNPASSSASGVPLRPSTFTTRAAPPVCALGLRALKPHAACDGAHYEGTSPRCSASEATCGTDLPCWAATDWRVS